MQYCPKCNIKIRGYKQCCPLCQGPLSGEPEEGAFPAVLYRRVSTLSFLRIVAFIWFTLEVGFGFAYYATGFIYTWILIVMAALLAGLADLAIAAYYRHNLIRDVTVETYIGILVCLLVDYWTGFLGWSVIWVVPCALAGLLFTTVLIAKIVHLRLVDYVIYLAIDVIAALLQAIPILQGHNTMPLPAIVVMCGSAIFLAAILAFRARDLESAAGKWLNL